MPSLTAYPLCWPEGWKRTEPAVRTRAKFGKADYTPAGGYTQKRDLTVADGTNRILAELGRMCVRNRDDVVLSTNLRLRLDGLPRSDQVEPKDPGVAVYWQDPFDDKPRCMAIDIYDRVAGNLGAVAATIEAMRAIERHGGAEILQRAFTGFTALPAPGQTAARSWREVLGFQLNAKPTYPEVVRVYRTLRSAAHPDGGGSPEKFNAVQIAYEQARQELR